MFLCTPDLIRAITPKLGRVLGPRGLMPSERRGTVTANITGFIRKLKGTSEWKGDKAGIIRAPIAKVYASCALSRVEYSRGRLRCTSPSPTL